MGKVNKERLFARNKEFAEKVFNSNPKIIAESNHQYHWETLEYQICDAVGMCISLVCYNQEHDAAKYLYNSEHYQLIDKTLLEDLLAYVKSKTQKITSNVYTDYEGVNYNNIEFND